MAELTASKWELSGVTFEPWKSSEQDGISLTCQATHEEGTVVYSYSVVRAAGESDRDAQERAVAECLAELNTEGITHMLVTRMVPAGVEAEGQQSADWKPVIPTSTTEPSQTSTEPVKEVEASKASPATTTKPPTAPKA